MASTNDHFQRAENHRLSLAMIVKNEAEHLEKCLSTARPWVDEIVIIDTGSTDGTQGIAARYADVLEEIEWPGSFSEARNASLERATGDYILILDGDEHIPDPAHWGLLKSAIRQPRVACVRMTVHNVLPDSQILAADRMEQERILRNDASIRYEGRVHNQILPSLMRYIESTSTRIVRIESEIVHVGYAYAKEKMYNKYESRLDLLKYEFENPATGHHRAYYGYQLGVAYFIMDRSQEAATVFNELNYSHLNSWNSYYTRILAANSNLRCGNIDFALLHADEALSMDRNEPIGYWTAGQALLKGGRTADAIRMLIAAYEQNQKIGHKVRFPLHEAQLFRVLGDVCRQVNLVPRAIFFYKEYLKRHPADEAARDILRNLELSAVTGSEAAA